MLGARLQVNQDHRDVVSVLALEVAPAERRFGDQEGTDSLLRHLPTETARADVCGSYLTHISLISRSHLAHIACARGQMYAGDAGSHTGRGKLESRGRRNLNEHPGGLDAYPRIPPLANDLHRLLRLDELPHAC